MKNKYETKYAIYEICRQYSTPWKSFKKSTQMSGPNNRYCLGSEGRDPFPEEDGGGRAQGLQEERHQGWSERTDVRDDLVIHRKGRF